MADKSEYMHLLNKSLITANKIKIKNEITEDKKIIQAIEALDDIIKTINIYQERKNKLCIYYDLNQSDQIIKEYKIDSETYTVINEFDIQLKNITYQKENIEKYIKKHMEKIAPNITYLLGHLLGARLIYRFGSLKKLSMVPSSTIQIIGAEKALFKHLRSKTPSPKHGLIYCHPLINLAPHKKRGKFSRVLSFIISLASRSDYYYNKLNPNLEILLKQKINKINK